MDIFGIPVQAFLGQLLLGLVNGSFYAILSLGLAVIFGLLGIVNFAHMTEAIRSMHEPVLWLANASFKPDWLPDKKPGAADGCR